MAGWPWKLCKSEIAWGCHQWQLMKNFYLFSSEVSKSEPLTQAAVSLEIILADSDGGTARSFWGGACICSPCPPTVMRLQLLPRKPLCGHPRDYAPQCPLNVNLQGRLCFCLQTSFPSQLPPLSKLYLPANTHSSLPSLPHRCFASAISFLQWTRVWFRLCIRAAHWRYPEEQEITSF